MSSITASGLGSGLDIDAIVRQLLAAEGNPQQLRLSQREAKLQTRLSAFGQFRSALEQLRASLEPLLSVDRFQGRAVAVGNDALLQVAASLDAAPGSYAIEVQQLASAQKLATGPFATAQDRIGWGTLSITVAGDAFDVTVAEGSDSLEDIRAAINSAAGNTGVTATLITANDGVRLVLTSTSTGAANTIGVAQSGGDGGLAQLTTLTEVQPARDARITLDGFTYDSASNVVTGAVSGLTLTLKAASPGNPTTVDVSNDGGASRAKVEEFVKRYNALVTAISSLTAFNADTRTGGPLLGDPTARNFLNSLRTEVVRAVAGNGSVASLTELGITTRVDGRLEIQSSRLDEALRDRFADVGRFFTTAESGLASRLDGLLDQYLDGDGLIKARTDGLQAGIRDIAKARDALEFRLEKLETRLRRQFSALDGLVGQLRSTSDFLTRQLATLTPSNQG